MKSRKGAAQNRDKGAGKKKEAGKEQEEEDEEEVIAKGTIGSCQIKTSTHQTHQTQTHTDTNTPQTQTHTDRQTQTHTDTHTDTHTGTHTEVMRTRSFALGGTGSPRCNVFPL